MLYYLEQYDLFTPWWFPLINNFNINHMIVHDMHIWHMYTEWDLYIKQ